MVRKAIPFSSWKKKSFRKKRRGLTNIHGREKGNTLVPILESREERKGYMVLVNFRTANAPLRLPDRESRYRKLTPSRRRNHREMYTMGLEAGSRGR